MRKIFLGLFVALIASFATVSTASAAPFVFTNGAAINIPDDATLTPASSIKVSMPGLVTRVEVRLKTVTHSWPADMDVMVETPSGDFVYLVSDQCGSSPITGFDWHFADDHPDLLDTNPSSCGNLTVKPGNSGDGDSWTTAPGAAPTTSFAGLTGTNQSGEWKLHITDDGDDDTGSIGNGWEIRIDSTTPDALRLPTTGTIGTAGPFTKSISGFPRTIADLDVVINDLTHTYPGDLDLALESPAGTKVIFASDGCEEAQPRNTDWIFDDESTSPYPDFYESNCETNLHRFAPANRELQETAFGSILTGGPFGSALSAFDGQFANGDWKLLVDDSASGDIGYIAGFDLAITMRGAKTETPSNPTFKFKKLGKRSIRATGRATLSGEALTAGECAGSVKSTFQVKSVRKKGKKRITTYKKVVAVNSTLTDKAGVCGFDISAKLPEKYSGKRLRLVTSYLGGEFIAPFTRATTEKIKKLKF